MRALIVGGSPDADALHVAALASGVGFIVAVDAGAETCEAAGIAPALVIGDMDSVGADTLSRLESSGLEVVRHPAKKDASDLALALAEVGERGCDEVTLTGVTGSRLDHTVAAFGLLACAAHPNVALDEPGLRGWGLNPDGRSTLELTGPGATVSVFALGGRGEAVSSGLEWSLAGVELGSLTSRGLSNTIVSEPARIDHRSGSLLVLSPQVDDVPPAREA